jgi:hypothetical protein
MRLSLASRILLVALTAIFVAGCISRIDEEGSPCPCGPGWSCCEVDSVGVCIREGEMCLNEDQKFLLSLEGTWVGTADEAPTASGSRRIEIEISLSHGGEPSLEGLNGTLKFGEDVESPVVDPDDPGLDVYNEDTLLDGFVFDIINPDIVDSRLLIEFKPASQWIGFCEAQTVLYFTEPNVYTCVPSWPNQCVDHICTFENPEGGEVQVKESKVDLCFIVCRCDETSCTLDESGHANQRLDLTVDIDNGIMLGTGDVGTIEAVRQ